MNRRIKLAAVLILAGAMALAGCGNAAPTPTATPPPTATAVPTVELLATETAMPVGGVEVGIAHLIEPLVPVVARVNGEGISKEDYMARIKQQLHVVTISYGVDWNDEAMVALLPSFQDEVLQQMADDLLVRQLAKQEGIVVNDSEVISETASVETDVLAGGQYATWADFLTAMGSDDADFAKQIASYLYQQKLMAAHGGPTEAEHVHAAHILVDTAELAQEVLDKLQAGSTFEALAAEYSTDTSNKDQGGDLGWFPRGVMVAEFEDVAFALAVGETSGVVPTQYGYHIIRVLEKQVRAMDADMLAQVQQQSFQTWYEVEKEKATLEILTTFAQPEPTPAS